MIRFLQLIILVIFVGSCSAPKKGEEKKKESETSESNEAAPPPVNEISEGYDGDIYKLVIKYINNRAIIYLSDSLIYDSKTVDGVFNVEIDLTNYVEAEMTDLKVEVYNGWPPYDTASPDWKIVYDIFVNDELVDFVSEESKKGDIGLVHTETHDLSDIW